MFRSLLVPVDFNDISKRPLEIALSLARSSGGRVTLLYAIDDRFPNPDILSFQLPWADYYRHLRETARQRLLDALAEVGAGEVAEVAIEQGAPAATIVRFAEHEKSDLIVIGTHGRSGIGQALIGSVTRKVLHDAPCPVLVVRLADEDA